MKRNLIALFVILLVAANIYVLMRQVSFIHDPIFPEYNRIETQIGSVTYSLYIADTPVKRTQGLSGVLKMPENHGMMFEFEKADVYDFWMKDMHFALDFIYLNEGTVVDIVENVSPDTYPNTISPSVPANKIIELHAGEVKKSGIKRGDTVTAVLR